MYKIEKIDNLWRIFLRVDYPSGDYAFYNQIGKSYYYKKSAENFLNKLKKGALS